MAWAGSAMRTVQREEKTATYRLHQGQLGTDCPGEKVGILEDGQNLTVEIRHTSRGQLTTRTL